MKSISIKIFICVTFLSFYQSKIFAEIVPPNYKFELKLLERFLPGNDYTKLEADKTLSLIPFEKNGDNQIIQTKLISSHYIIEIYLQINSGQITSSFIKFPQHFSHDQLLDQLQKQYKKQDQFTRKDMSALYTWNNREGKNILYHGTCTISCFPLFIEFVQSDGKSTTLYQKFNDLLPTKW